ncbi:glycogenin glucosyltransferase [Microsporum audouinii]
MAAGNGAVYCTILLSDNYLPGAMVLAHSLRDNGTKGRLAVLVTLDNLQPGIIDELKTVYDDVIPIPRIENSYPGNLYLMDRPDLISTFSKIALWKQTQYDRIVYIDADVIALRAPDELLTLDFKSIAAVPDIGWPDCFNTGVIVLRPNLKDYYALLAFAQRGISFDGADQGLLNMHFKNWDRLSFTYNCTPSGHYQYVPAYRYFESTISLVHFIGSLKPWRIGRSSSPQQSPYNQLLAKWWAVYDRHYRTGPIYIPQPRHYQSQTSSYDTGQKTGPIEPTQSEEKATGAVGEEKYSHSSIPTQPAAINQEKLEGTIEVGAYSQRAPDIQVIHHDQNTIRHDTASSPHEICNTTEPEKDHQPSNIPLPEPMVSAVPQFVRGEEHISVPIYHGHPPDILTHIPHTNFNTQSPHTASPSEDRGTLQPHGHETSLTKDTGEERSVGGKTPEVESVAPSTGEILRAERTSSPPLAVWDASRAPPPVDSKPEAATFPVQIYTMSKDTELFQPPTSYPEAPKNMYYQVPTTAPTATRQTSAFPWERSAPTPTRVFIGEDAEPSKAAEASSPSSRPASLQSNGSSGGFESYSRNNAWDDMPEIEKYMRSLQKPRRVGVSVISGPTHTRNPSAGLKSPARKSNLRQTHYPPEREPPSPAVTPALVMRGPSTSSTADGISENEELPAAEGVPSQAEWNPVQRLKELQWRQSQFLEKQIDLMPRDARTNGTFNYQQSSK